jgi:phosphopantothenoylcysteine decarboxylase/phosphopantothenate--cysteine ligase
MDSVRFLSNASSGKMGYEIAREASARGADVILVSGPTRIDPPAGVRTVRVGTAAEMEKAVRAAFPKADVVVMAAAVSDFRFSATAARKVPKRELADTVGIVPTPDILKGLGKKKGKKVLVGFAAETEETIPRAGRKLKEKNLDLIVANDVGEAGVGFESDDNLVAIVDASGAAAITERMSKREISRIVLDRIEAVIHAKK